MPRIWTPDVNKQSAFTILTVIRGFAKAGCCEEQADVRDLDDSCMRSIRRGAIGYADDGDEQMGESKVSDRLDCSGILCEIVNAICGQNDQQVLHQTEVFGFSRI